MAASTTLTRHDVERHLITARMRQTHAEQFGTTTSAKTYAERVDYWLELWAAAQTDKAVRI
jgi:hypothetical protein